MTHAIRPQRGLERIWPYVPGTPIGEVKRELGLDDVIKLASNENPLGVSPNAAAAIRDALACANRYPDGASHDLRAAIGRRFGFPIDAITVGNGADDLILQVSMAYLDEGDEVLVSQSSFPIYDVYAHAMRARLVKAPLGAGYRIDLEAMAARLSERTKLVYICNPNNPTGTIVGAAAVDEFLQRVPDRTLVVFDEAYAEMVDGVDYPDALRFVRDGRSNVLVLRTFSKVYGLAGVRLGYGFGRPETVAPLFRVKPAFTVSTLAQAAGIAALDDEEFLQRSIAANRAERQRLYHEYGRLGLEYAESHTNFILVRIGPHAPDVARALLERGIIVRPGAGYDLPEFLRISIGSPEENRRLILELGSILGGLDRAS